MPVTIRNATAREIPLLVEMMGEFYAESGYALDETWAKAAFAALLGDESYGAAWIVGRDGEPAGYVVLTLRFSMEQGGLEGCIDDLFVRPDARRRGLGRILLETLLAECKRRRVLAVLVEVGRDNAAAQALYESCGLHPRDDDRQTFVMRC